MHVDAGRRPDRCNLPLLTVWCCLTLLLSERQRQIKSLKKAEAELGRIEKREERKKTAASSGEGAMPAVDPSS